MRGSLILILVLFSMKIVGQSRKLSPTINKNAINITAPSISANGMSLLYLSDYTSTGDLTMMRSEFKGGWQAPEILPQAFNSSKLNFAYGSFLNFDGSRLYFTSRRSGSKGFDIWSVDYNKGEWGRPKTLGLPINSLSNEGAPSLTPDENEMYFCRCTSMLNYNASGCEIYYTSKANGVWSEPIVLPASINEGNVMSPRIMADGITLVYASNKPGGKGKFDLYMSKKDTEGNWSSPVALDYINTAEDDMVVSSRIYGNLMLIGKKEGKFDQIHEFLIPDEFKPGKVLYLNYELIRDNFNRPAKLVVQDWNSGKELKVMDIDSGLHNLVLNEGTKYHLMIQPVHLLRSPVSKIYDVTELARSTMDQAKFEVTSVSKGDQINLFGIQMEKESPHFPDKYDRLVDHTIRMVKGLDKEVELQLVQTNYMEDTIFVHEDLTEFRMDTTYSTKVDTIWLAASINTTIDMDSLVSPVPPQMDSSLVAQIADIDEEEEEEPIDFLEDYTESDSVSLVLGVDSLGVYAEIYYDTLSEQPPFELQETQVMKVTKIFHNDRFEKESEELMKRMGMLGVPIEKIKIVRKREESEESKPDRFLRIVIQ